jgi:mannan endo-1,4-beta-mannosidase
MEAHIEDAEKYLGMPVVFTEFGVSSKNPGYNLTYRDTVISTVYSSILNSTKKGGSGAGAGSLLWQMIPEDTDVLDDGYAIVFSKSPSTSSIVSLHSYRLNLFNTLCSSKCNWSCKKKKMLEKILYHDEL